MLCNNVYEIRIVFGAVQKCGRSQHSRGKQRTLAIRGVDTAENDRHQKASMANILPKAAGELPGDPSCLSPSASTVTAPQQRHAKCMKISTFRECVGPLYQCRIEQANIAFSAFSDIDIRLKDSPRTFSKYSSNDRGS